MADIVWLASYPKSGNTWVRVLLTNYLRDGDSPADINELDGGPIASARQWFDEWAGVEASALDDDTIELLRPAVYRCMARAASQRLYMKVHDAWLRLDGGEAMFPPDVTGCVVYVARNPLDVVASLANHASLTLEAATQVLCTPDHVLARTQARLSQQLRQRLGDWSRHVGSWLDDSALPVHLVRYEDLKARPEACLADIVVACGLPAEPARLAKAVAFSSFGELSRQEAEHGFKERLTTSTGAFFRRGRAGGWREELSADLVAQIVDAHGPMMRRLGYLDADGRPT